MATYLKDLQKRGQRYFTINELMQDLGLSKNAALNAVFRSKKHGDLISPARGLYVIVPPECQPYGSIPAEDLTIILMKYLQSNYYVSLLSGAAFYGATHQKPNSLQIITNKCLTHPLQFGQIKLDLIHKKSLANLPTKVFPMHAGYLKVATPELVTFDLLSYIHRSAGLNHIATVLSELIEAMDASELITLGSKIAPNYHFQRLGYLLERIEVMDEAKRDIIIKKLAEYLANKVLTYIPLASELPKNGYSKCKKWKIIENTDVESDL